MAFTDMPQIDEASKNSDLSSVKLLGFISQRNGFIAREDIPDKGCDYDVELILESANVSNWRFGVQLKSIVLPTIIENGAFISYSFETSRLGYLVRRNPGMGIIALYSVEGDCIFYDFVENIYRTITEERDDESWMNQKTVNIKISTSNLLNDTSIVSIHEYYVNKFTTAAIMSKSHGLKYGLPVIDIGVSKGFDVNNSDDVVDTLKRYGISLLSTYDLDMVYNLVSKLTMSQINQSKEIQIVAAIAFCEAGKHAEAAYYFDRIKRRTDIAEHEKGMIEFAHIKNDLALGILSWDEFDRKCEELKGSSELLLNTITLDINQNFLQILRLNPNADVPQDLLNAIISNFDKIADLDVNANTKSILEVWNSDNLSMIMGALRTRAYGRQKVRDAMNLPLSLEERREAASSLIVLEQQFISRLNRLKEKVQETNDKYLQANLILTFNRHYISHEIEQVSFRVNAYTQERVALTLHHLEQSIIGYQIFIDQNRFKEAYQSICNAVEFVTLLDKYYNIEEIPNRLSVLEACTLLEQDLELPAYNPTFLNVIENAQAADLEDISASVENYKDLTDEEIDYNASIVIEALKLPKERIWNIVKEMKAQRLFYSRCTNPNLELKVYDPFRTEHNRFEYPTRFVIRSKATRLETGPSADMETLLGHWKL